MIHVSHNPVVMTGVMYNHSLFCDIYHTHLVGSILRPLYSRTWHLYTTLSFLNGLNDV